MCKYVARCLSYLDFISRVFEGPIKLSDLVKEDNVRDCQNNDALKRREIEMGTYRPKERGRRREREKEKREREIERKRHIYTHGEREI